MHRFITWAGLGHKSKQQKQSLRYGTGPPQPKDECEEKKDVVATDMACCLVDLGPADVTRRSTSESNDEDVSACNDDANTGRPASIHSVPSHGPTSPNALADIPNRSSVTLTEQTPASLSRPRRSKSIFTTLSKSFRTRVRTPLPPRHTPNKPVPARTQDNRRLSTYRPQAVPVVLSDDPVSRERRESALRARGLLPARPRDLSAVEADADRRIDARRNFESPFSGPDNGHSDANEIAQSWRLRNSMWLSDALPSSDSPGNPITEDAFPVDTASHPEGSSEPPTVDADPSASISPLSNSGSLSLGFPTHSHKAASSRGSIGREDSQLSRAASLSSTGSEGLVLPSFNLEDFTIESFTRGISEDITTDFPQLTPDLPAPSEASCVAGSQVAETPEVSAPSRHSVSASLHLEYSQPTCSVDQLPSESHNVAVKTKLTIPASAPLYLLSTASDTCLASPTTPTLSQSVCYSSSETEDSSATTDNGEHNDSPVLPVIKNGEGGILFPETIVEGSEQDDDIDAFHSPPSPSLLTVIPRTIEDGRAATPQRTPHTLLSRLRSTRSTLSSTPSSALSKSTSMANLRRKLSLFGQTRPPSTVLHIDTPRSPPPSPLLVQMYDQTALSAEASRITDDEARRLSELAFMT